MADLPTLDGHLARRIAEKKARLDRFCPLDPAIVRHLRDEFRLLLTYHSNAIEGNTLTLRETQLVIEQGITVGGKALREHLEATNHAEAFDLLLALADGTAPITVETICALHRVVLDKIDPHAGQLRHIPVRIRGASLLPPPAQAVPDCLAQWEGWCASADAQAAHTVVRAAVAHHGFEAIHPFIDGNGRVGRLILNLMLLRDGYPPAIIPAEHRIAYIHTLDAADRGDYRGLLTVVSRAVEASLDRYLEACDVQPHHELLPLHDLASATGISADYLGWLLRHGKLVGEKRAGRWYARLAVVERYQRDVAEGQVPRGRPRRER